MEALCPFCRAFTLHKLAPLFDNGVSSLMDLKLVPWGNARGQPAAKNVTCQHGPAECSYNRVLGCLVHLFPQQERWFPAAHCIEKKGWGEREDFEGVTRKCADKAGLDSAAIWDCYDSDLSWKLQEGFRQQTEALQPPHTGVPWVTVEGMPMYDATDFIQSLVCVAYKGEAPRPPACWEDPGPADPSLLDVRGFEQRSSVDERLKGKGSE